MDLERIQRALDAAGFDGWLFYDFQNRDKMAYSILGLDPDKMTTRRWFYFIPREGNPRKLAHSVEKGRLDPLPGEKTVYFAWKELHTKLREILGEPGRIAMQYSPLNNIPYVSVVDGGTIELVRSYGHEVVSSADLVQTFEAIIDQKGYESHLKAGEKVQMIKDEAFMEIGKAISEGKKITEYEVQRYIVRRFDEEGLTCDGEFPIVAINEHAADPHFEPAPDGSYVIKNGDMLLIDLWAKLVEPGSIFYDITWCGYIGKKPPEKYVEMFDVVTLARDAAVDFVTERFAEDVPTYGWEVDDACRAVVAEAGYGDYFVHRTGHSIGEAVHGNGVNIDNLETKDERRLVPGICFSIEPGIYLEGEMGVRSEVNVFIKDDNEVVVAGEKQQGLILIP
ncbi:MAG: M24 family metallopeptidase [Candidatus Glassbacteria bacterium]